MTNANCMDRALKSGTEADVHTKRKAKEKKRSKILLLAPVGADDLLLSLKAALKDGQLFDFELMEEALPVEQLTLQARILAKDIERDQPNMVVLCDGFLSRLETVFELIRERHHGIPIIVAARFPTLR